MAAMVKLDARGIVYGTISTLLDRCLQSIVNNWEATIDGMMSLPANLKDKCIFLMSKRGTLNDDNISKVLHEKVKVLDLSDCVLSDVGLNAVCKCRNLYKIDLNSNKESRTSIFSEGVRRLALSCRHLHTLYLRRCVNITDNAIVALSQSCAQLRLLNISECHNITDVLLQALGEHSKYLRSINLSNTQITDVGVTRLVSGQCAHSLTEIHINGF